MPTLFDFGDEDKLYRSAEISECGKYRYSLRRAWYTPDSRKTLCWVMLNPSLADAMQDDPTIRRCMGFARAWGYASISVVNLFALRATDPRELLAVADPVGPYADLHLWRCRGQDTTIVAAWGAKVPLGRDAKVLEIFKGWPLWCLGTSKSGAPRHPLYVRADQPLVLFERKVI